MVAGRVRLPSVVLKLNNMNMNKKELDFTRVNGDFVCQYGELTITIDEGCLWDYAVHNGYHEWSKNGFDPNSRYGHTQECGEVEMDDYLKSVDKSVLIEYITYNLSK